MDRESMYIEKNMGDFTHNTTDIYLQMEEQQARLMASYDDGGNFDDVNHYVGDSLNSTQAKEYEEFANEQTTYHYDNYGPLPVDSSSYSYDDYTTYCDQSQQIAQDRGFLCNIEEDNNSTTPAPSDLSPDGQRKTPEYLKALKKGRAHLSGKTKFFTVRTAMPCLSCWPPSI